MSHIEETSWAKRTTWYGNRGNFTITRPTWKKAGVDLALKVIGTAAMFGIGKLFGEGLDHVPYFNEWLPQAVNYFSAIDVSGNLDGLVGVLGAVYGAANSGVTLNKDTLEPKKYEISPIHVTLK